MVSVDPCPLAPIPPGTTIGPSLDHAARSAHDLCQDTIVLLGRLRRLLDLVGYDRQRASILEHIDYLRGACQHLQGELRHLLGLPFPSGPGAATPLSQLLSRPGTAGETIRYGEPW